MLRLLRLLSILSARFFRTRCELLLENLALRQQLAVLKQSILSRGLPLMTDSFG
jgi:hypothetical protein